MGATLLKLRQREFQRHAFAAAGWRILCRRERPGFLTQITQNVISLSLASIIQV